MTIENNIPGSHMFINNSDTLSSSDQASRLVVGRDISMQGEIKSCAHLVIEGEVQAEIFSGSRMDVMNTGVFRGTAELQDCVIAGRFEGKLIVAGKLTVKETGWISGEIEYGAIEVENGGKIEGQMIFVQQAVSETVEAPVEARPTVEAVSDVETLFVANANEEEDDDDDEEEGTLSSIATRYRRVSGQ